MYFLKVGRHGTKSPVYFGRPPQIALSAVSFFILISCFILCYLKKCNIVSLIYSVLFHWFTLLLLKMHLKPEFLQPSADWIEFSGHVIFYILTSDTFSLPVYCAYTWLMFVTSRLIHISVKLTPDNENFTIHSFWEGK